MTINNGMQIRTAINLIESAQAPRVVYHVTLKASVKRILAQGLVPKIGPRSRKLGEKEPAVYCFPDVATAEDALGGWLGDALPEDAALVLLRINLRPELPTRSDVGFEIAVLGAIPPSAIEIADPNFGG